NRLLRQPGGFEGLGTTSKALTAGELPVFHRPHLPEGELRPCAALLAAAVKGRFHDHRVASVDQLIELGLNVVELASQPTDEHLVPLGSVEDASAVGD